MTESEMETRLKSKYPSAEVAVIDMTGNKDNFEVRISATAFVELSRVERTQSVMATFNDELKSGEVHALSIRFL